MNRSKNYLYPEIEDKLQSWFSNFRKVVIAGIGYSLRKDDFVGVKTVRYLKDKVSSSVHLIECETIPESFIERIIELNPSHILIIDAANLDLEPGATKFISYKKLHKHQAVSTHALPLRIFCQYLVQMTKAKIALLVIQPKDTSFGEGLTQELEDAAKEMAKLLSKVLSG